MRLFRTIANEVSKIAWEIKDNLNGNFDLWRYCYPIIRAQYPQVNSRMLDYIIRIVGGCYTKKKRSKLKEPVEFHRDFLLFDKRLFSFNGNHITIWTVAGHKELPFTFVPAKRFRQWWEMKEDIDSIILVERPNHNGCKENGVNGKIVGFVCLTIPDPVKKNPLRFVGVDIGAECPLVAIRDDGAIFFPNYEMFHKKRRHFFEQRRRLQAKLAAQRLLGKDAHNTIRQLRKLSGKQRRFTKQFLNWVVCRLFDWMGDAVIVMEQLRLPQGKKVKGAKALNRTLSLLPSGIIKRAIVEKATEKGLPVIFVNPRGTSQTCPQCGEKGERIKRDEFKCPICGFSSHADIVGAMNILKRGLERFSQSGAEMGDKPIGLCQPLKDLPADEAGEWNPIIVGSKDSGEQSTKFQFHLRLVVVAETQSMN